MTETKMLIRGKPIEEFTKEELIEELIMTWQIIDTMQEQYKKKDEYLMYLDGWARYTAK